MAVSLPSVLGLGAELWTLHHFGIRCNDLERQTADFARFGYSLHSQFDLSDSPITMRFLTHATNPGIELVCFTGSPSDWYASLPEHVGFSTTNLDIAISKVLEKGSGWELVSGPSPGIPISRFAFVRSVSGALVELVEP